MKKIILAVAVLMMCSMNVAAADLPKFDPSKPFNLVCYDNGTERQIPSQKYSSCAEADLTTNPYMRLAEEAKEEEEKHEKFMKKVYFGLAALAGLLVIIGLIFMLPRFVGWFAGSVANSYNKARNKS